MYDPNKLFGGGGKLVETPTLSPPPPFIAPERGKKKVRDVNSVSRHIDACVFPMICTSTNYPLVTHTHRCTAYPTTETVFSRRLRPR